ncbi:MAG: hypothetical protein ACMVY4_04595 [Minwuia sp.]|uniref:hypothetical protein n=1 Tax=Minwuia sp. TaxID=2493630 RepID=UPI003A8466C5
MEHPSPLTHEEARRRRSRNVVLALALVAFVALVFAGSLVKMSGGDIPVLNNTVGG